MFIALLPLVCLLPGKQLRAQEPSLFLTEKDFHSRLQVSSEESWAKQSLQTLVNEADDFPKSYTLRFGLSAAEPPPKEGQWLHWYACPETGTSLRFEPPNHNICPDTGKDFQSYPYDEVVYQLRNDALGEAAVALGLAFRFTGKHEYARKGADILRAYTRVYPTYALHDIHGLPGMNGAKAYAQTLDESLWLIKIAWAYDLLRGSGDLAPANKVSFERDVLRVSAEVIRKAHKEPTYNIQSWIHAALGSVGYVLGDQALIAEAIDGPIGFRHQMATFVHEGLWEEGAWGYQFYAMRPLTMLAQMATKRGTDLWRQEPALLSLFHGPLGVVLPDGSLPAFNDSGTVDLYSKDFLYESAYGATHDRALLSILSRSKRDNREAFLFGVEQLPSQTASSTASEVLPAAGYSTLRASSGDLTAVIKFGSHGGAHGHYDKLNFVFFADGQTLAIDPGTQPYGLPIHREWDSQTIAHNTITVDQQRQRAATGSLQQWHTEKGWTAARVDAGPVYSQAALQRTLLLTPEYLLVLDECRTLDGQPHQYDWAYHGAGITQAAEALKPLEADALPKANGYAYLLHPMGIKQQEPFSIRFTTAPRQAKDGHGGNSTPETIRSGPTTIKSDSTTPVQVDVQVSGQPASEYITGSAPGPNLKTPIPFLVVRRAGKAVTFAAAIVPSRSATAISVNSVRVSETAGGVFVIEGSTFQDTFNPHGSFSYARRRR